MPCAVSPSSVTASTATPLFCARALLWSSILTESSLNLPMISLSSFCDPTYRVGGTSMTWTSVRASPATAIEVAYSRARREFSEPSTGTRILRTCLQSSALYFTLVDTEVLWQQELHDD